jgi:outer membrane protein
MLKPVLFILLAAASAACADTSAPLTLTVSEAVTRAMAANPAIAEAAARRDAARAEASMARAMLGLQVAGGAFAGSASRETMLEAVSSDPSLSAPLDRTASVGLQIALMVPVSTSGRLEANLRQARAMADEASAALTAERARVAAAVKEAFARVLYTEAMVRVAEADKEAARRMAENARAEWEAGRGIEASYLRAVARAQAAERSLALASSERTKARIQLATEIGLPPDTPIQAVGDLTLRKLRTGLAETVSDGLKAAPMLTMMRLQSRAAAEGARAAASSWRPQVYAAVMGGVSSPPGMSGSRNGAVGLTASIPLFDGGLRRQAHMRAHSQAAAAAAGARSSELELESAIRSAWADMEAAEASLAAARAGVEAATAAYRVVELRVQNQKSILVEQLDALTAVREAEEAVAQALFAHEVAVIKIEQLLGRE